MPKGRKRTTTTQPEKVSNDSSKQEETTDTTSKQQSEKAPSKYKETEALIAESKDPNAPRMVRRQSAATYVREFVHAVEDIDTEKRLNSSQPAVTNTLISMEDPVSEPPRSLSQAKETIKRVKEKSSIAWYFFVLLATKKYECLLRPEKCSAKIHPKSVAGPVGNLWEHLRTWHSTVHAAIEQAATKGKDLPSTAEALKKVWSPITSTTQSGMDRFVHLMDKKLPKTMREMSLLIWAISSSIPLHSFDSPQWKDFCVLSDVSILGSTSLTSTHLPVLFHSVQNLLGNRLLQARSVAIATDSWDSSGPFGKVIGIVYHFILSINGKLTKFTHSLDFISAPISHTASCISSILSAKIDERLGDFATLAAAVTDNGANFVKAADFLTENVRCTSHSCQLVLHKLSQEQDFKSIIESINSFITAIRNKSACRNLLRNLQKTPLELILPCPTRWNSIYYMLKRFLELLAYIHLLLKEPVAESLIQILPSEEDIKKISLFLDVAKPIIDLSLWAEGDYITLPNLAPKLEAVYTSYSNTSVDIPLLKAKLQEAALVLLKRRFHWVHNGASVALMASALHPYHGHLSSIPAFQRDQIWENLVSLGVDLFPPAVETELALPLAPALTEDDLRSGLLKLRKYFEINAHRFNENIDVLEWWNDYKYGEPLLSIVQHLFAIPVSSASAERAFSNAGFISECRENLSLIHVEQMAVIRAAFQNRDDAKEIYNIIRNL